MTSPNKTLAYWTRWFCLPPTVFAVFMFLGLALQFLNSVVHVWFEPTAGFILALVWVLSAQFIAPARKPIASVVAFAVGAMFAWKRIGYSWYPENHPKAYQPTHIPILMTISGGLLGLAVSMTIEMMKKTPNQASHPPSGPSPGSGAGSPGR